MPRPRRKGVKRRRTTRLVTQEDEEQSEDNIDEDSNNSSVDEDIDSDEHNDDDDDDDDWDVNGRSVNSRRTRLKRKGKQLKERKTTTSSSSHSGDDNDEDELGSNDENSDGALDDLEDENVSFPKRSSTRLAAQMPSVRRSTRTSSLRQQQLRFRVSTKQNDEVKESSSDDERASRRKQSKDDEDYDEEAESSSSSEEEESIRNAKSNLSSRPRNSIPARRSLRQQRIRFQGRKMGNHKDEQDSSESESKRRGKSKAKPSIHRRRNLRQQRIGYQRSRKKADTIHKEEDETSDDEAIETPRRSASRKTRRSARLAKPNENSNGLSSSSNEEEPAGKNVPRNTPPRASAKTASAKIRQTGSEFDSDEDASSSEGNYPMANKRKVLSSDEEFLADDSDSDKSSADSSMESESELEINEDLDDIPDDSSLERSEKAVNIDDEQVGTAGESSSSEDNMKVASKKVQGKKKEIPSIFDDDGADGDDTSASSSNHSTISASKRQIRNTTPKLPPCPSTSDAITAETLPKIHVCYIPPDGQSRQCFALETLRHIALSTVNRQYRHDNVAGECQTFLQPPHFRTAMSDFLLDQIASRFGRGALDLHGDFYNRNKIDEEENEEDDMFLPSQTLLRDEEEFLNRLRSYLDSQMGSRDVYACPLCYSEMHIRVVKSETKGNKKTNDVEDDEKDDDGESDDDDDDTIPTESVYDPMLVLGHLDDDNFEAASTFCFTKVAALKVHLREDHNVSTKGIEGNDLYMRFRVRAPDGLLQRYIKQKARYIGTFQGDMRRYWNEGNNQSFILLLQQMERAEFHRAVLGHDVEEAESFFHEAKSFFESFSDRVKRQWERLSAPFRKTKGDDMKDFLVNDEIVDEESENETPHFVTQQNFSKNVEGSSDDENNFVNKLKRKYAEREDGSESEHGSSASEAATDESAHPSDLDRYYSEVEEDDEWVKNIRKKRASRSKQPPATTSKMDTPGKRLKKRKALSGSSTVSPNSEATTTPVSKKRTITEYSDED